MHVVIESGKRGCRVIDLNGAYALLLKNVTFRLSLKASHCSEARRAEVDKQVLANLLQLNHKRSAM